MPVLIIIPQTGFQYPMFAHGPIILDKKPGRYEMIIPDQTITTLVLPELIGYKIQPCYCLMMPPVEQVADLAESRALLTGKGIIPDPDISLKDRSTVPHRQQSVPGQTQFVFQLVIIPVTLALFGIGMGSRSSFFDSLQIAPDPVIIGSIERQAYRYAVRRVPEQFWIHRKAGQPGQDRKSVVVNIDRELVGKGIQQADPPALIPDGIKASHIRHLPAGLIRQEIPFRPGRRAFTDEVNDAGNRITSIKGR